MVDWQKVDLLRATLQAAQARLEYLERQFPTTTTPQVIAKIERVLKETLA